MQFLIAGTFAVISLVGEASQCPSVCNCTHYQQDGFYVDCSSQHLHSIPTDLPKKTYILDLSYNAISNISYNFNNIPALQQLKLSSNNISKLSYSLNNIPALQKLDLSLNKISKISYSLNNLPALQKLDLTWNKISNISYSLNNIPALQQLMLSMNNISKISYSLNNIPAIQQLNLAFNTISSIEDNTFNNLPALESIDLSFNTISFIEDNAFSNLPALESIYLKDNKITRVEAWLFSGLPNITEINMKWNNISFVSKNAFQNLLQLTTLEFEMYCGCNFNIPFWQWFTEDTTKFRMSISCYDYPQLYLEDLVQSNFYQCNETRSIPSTTKSRTTATPTSRTTITTTPAARITRKKLESTAFAPRTVIGIAIGAGSLAGGILLFCVIWRLWRRSNDKNAKFEQQQDKINSMIPAIPPSTFPQRPTKKPQYII